MPITKQPFRGTATLLYGIKFEIQILREGRELLWWGGPLAPVPSPHNTLHSTVPSRLYNIARLGSIYVRKQWSTQRCP